MPVKKGLLLLLILGLTACETVAYYTQAFHGQFTILTQRRDIEDVVKDPETDNQLRSQLETVLSVRQFAESEMHLPVENNFSTYVDLEQPFVVWNVFAAPEFSLDAKQWCYPIAGCVTYRGYFTEGRAYDYAREIEAEGFDTYVGGVAAYSTLGWFADPVLNTIVNREEHRLASLIFHELAHQVIYVPGDTEFNESFATAVEMEGLRRWLEINGKAENASAIVAQASLEKSRRLEFVGLVQGVIPQLESLYQSDKTVEDKRREKAVLIQSLREQYQVLKAGWGDYDAYDNWFSSEINNAKLRTVSTYFNRVPAFDALLAEVDFDLPLFYERVEELSRLDTVEREAAIARLAP